MGSLGVRRESSTTCNHSGNDFKKSANDATMASSWSIRWTSSTTSSADAGCSHPSSAATSVATSSRSEPGPFAGDARPPRPSTSSASAAATAVQNCPPSRSVSSRDSHAVGAVDVEHQSTSNDVLPDPAGATTEVIGAFAASSSSWSRRGRRR